MTAERLPSRFASGDRFYDTNGLSKTPAQWLATLLSGQMERLGL